VKQLKSKWTVIPVACVLVLAVVGAQCGALDPRVDELETRIEALEDQVGNLTEEKVTQLESDVGNLTSALEEKLDVLDELSEILDLLIDLWVSMPGNSTVPGGFWQPPADVPSSTAWVLSDDVPARVEAAARNMKLTYGDLIQFCDGTTDNTEFNTAIDVLPSGGGDVLLVGNTFDFSSAVSMTDNVAIIGNSRDGVVITSSAGKAFDAEDVSGCHFEGFSLAAADNDHFGIELDGTGNTSIVNIGFTGFKRAIYVWNGATDTRIESCLCHSAEQSFVYNKWGTDGVYNLEIIGNTVRNTKGMAVYVNYGGHDIRIQNNTFIDCNYDTPAGNPGVITVYAKDGVCDLNNVITTDNTIRWTSDPVTNIHGILVSLEGCSSAVVENIDVSDNTILTEATVTTNVGVGIYFHKGTTNFVNVTVTGNTIIGLGHINRGITLYGADYFTCSANTIRSVQKNGIYLSSSDYGTVTGNTISDYDKEVGGNEAIEEAGTSTHNIIRNNTGQASQTFGFPFIDGTAYDDQGWDIDAADEYATAFARVPEDVVEITCMRIWAYSVVTEADGMCLEISVNGAGDNEAWNTHSYAGTDVGSVSTNFAAGDIIYWEVTEAALLALVGGDSVVVKVLHEAGSDGYCATDARFRCVEFEYK